MDQKTDQKEQIEVIKPEIDTQIVRLGQSNPQQLVEKAKEMANVLAPIIDKQNLYSNIGGKKYVRAEGWTTMLAMLGIFPEVVWSRKVDIQDKIIYEARVILKTLKGEVISAAEAMCSSDEKNWAKRDEYAIRSMAQTRATGKAARLPFAWIMSLAGFEATPAEEIDTETFVNKEMINDKLASLKQIKLIYVLIKQKANGEAKDKEQAMFWLQTVMDKPEPFDVKAMTSAEAKEIIEFLMNYKSA